MKVFITKFPLTKGIIELEGKLSESDNHYFYADGYCSSFLKSEWHETLDEAVKNAEERKTKKLISLEKQIERISSLKFELKK